MKFIISEFAKPLFRRAGTFVGSFAVGGSTVADAAQIEAAVVMLLGFAFDLWLSHKDRT